MDGCFDDVMKEWAKSRVGMNIYKKIALRVFFALSLIMRFFFHIRVNILASPSFYLFSMCVTSLESLLRRSKNPRVNQHPPTMDALFFNAFPLSPPASLPLSLSLSRSFFLSFLPSFFLSLSLSLDILSSQFALDIPKPLYFFFPFHCWLVPWRESPWTIPPLSSMHFLTLIVTFVYVRYWYYCSLSFG